MGDCWIYYCELCLPGKKWDKKMQRVPQTRHCGSEYLNKVDLSASIHQTHVREVVADHFKRKTQLQLQLQYAEPMENGTHLWCFASADHDRTRFGCRSEENSTFQRHPGESINPTAWCTKWDSETCNNNHLSLIYYKLLLRKNHLLIWRHTFNCVAHSVRTVTVTRLWRGFPLGVSRPGEKLPTGAAASICQSLSALRGTADLVAMFHLQLPLRPH